MAMIVCSVAAVTVVRRVQAAPFAPLAELVARLQPASNVSLPGYFDADPAAPPVAYAPFAGLGVVVTSASPGGISGHCLYVLDADTLATASSSRIDGPLRFGCSADAFPAVVQFVVTAEDPKALRAAVPLGGAIQLVYDSAEDEVVVFTVVR